MTAGGWEEEYESGAEEYERWARKEMEREHWAEEERKMGNYLVVTQKGMSVVDRDFLNLQLSPDDDEWETWMSARRDLFCRAADARYLEESEDLRCIKVEE